MYVRPPTNLILITTNSNQTPVDPLRILSQYYNRSALELQSWSIKANNVSMGTSGKSEAVFDLFLYTSFCVYFGRVSIK